MYEWRFNDQFPCGVHQKNLKALILVRPTALVENRDCLWTRKRESINDDASCAVALCLISNSNQSLHSQRLLPSKTPKFKSKSLSQNQNLSQGLCFSLIHRSLSSRTCICLLLRHLYASSSLLLSYAFIHFCFFVIAIEIRNPNSLIGTQQDRKTG